MKPINLYSLVDAKKTLPSELFNSYSDNFQINIKESEVDDLAILINEFQDIAIEFDILEGFYVGYTINQISKEFDLLRFGEEFVINIELKSKSNESKIKKQLQANKYYLSFLNTEVYHYTYVVENEKLFYLGDNGELAETKISSLASLLEKQTLDNIEDIDMKFDPTSYLVSPFNSPDAFMKGAYFLTDHQVNIKKEIIEIESDKGTSFVTIQGSAGTGKTLLIYDLAKEYINRSRKVLIFHCGSLNEGHDKLRTDYSWRISPIKSLSNYDLKEYNLVIVDEAHRIYSNQLEELLDNAKAANTICVFSYDFKQCLANWEVKRNVPGFLEEKVSNMHFQLTTKIRTNQEISSFIKNLFKLSSINPNQKYSNINIQYFSRLSGAKEYMALLKRKGWKIINYTPTMYGNNPYDRYHDIQAESAHNVIGQEFDNVVAVIDQYFYYNQEGILSIRDWEPYYDPVKMLFQIVTRTRKKLTLIIIKNEEVLSECLKILQ